MHIDQDLQISVFSGSRSSSGCSIGQQARNSIKKIAPSDILENEYNDSSFATCSTSIESASLSLPTELR